MEQDGWKTQDGRMTKTCPVRSGMHSLARHFFRYSAVLSFPAVVLRKLATVGMEVGRQDNLWKRASLGNFPWRENRVYVNPSMCEILVS